MIGRVNNQSIVHTPSIGTMLNAFNGLAPPGGRPGIAGGDPPYSAAAPIADRKRGPHFPLPARAWSRSEFSFDDFASELSAAFAHAAHFFCGGEGGDGFRPASLFGNAIFGNGLGGIFGNGFLRHARKGFSGEGVDGRRVPAEAAFGERFGFAVGVEEAGGFFGGSEAGFAAPGFVAAEWAGLGEVEHGVAG